MQSQRDETELSGVSVRLPKDVLVALDAEARKIDPVLPNRSLVIRQIVERHIRARQSATAEKEAA